MALFEMILIIVATLSTFAIVIGIAIDKSFLPSIAKILHIPYNREIVIIIVSVFSAIAFLFLFFALFPNQFIAPPPSPAPTPSQFPAFSCPTSDEVSAWMNVTVSRVNESCAFTAGNNGKQLSGVICTNQDGGTTIEYVPVSEQNTLVVRVCNGSQLPDMWGFTIRFVRGYPSGDASV